MHEDRLSVFLVEDSLLVRQRLAQLLVETGEARIVGEAADAASAIAGLKALRPDVAIIDLQLSDDSSGLEVLATARQAGLASTLIVLTNNSEPKQRALCLTAGADHFFDKATEFELLPALLTQIKQSRGARPQPVAEDAAPPPAAPARLHVLLVEAPAGSAAGWQHGRAHQLLDALPSMAVDWARSYGEGAAALSRRQHDVCLIDAHLGERSGLELLEEIRRAEEAPPRILLADHDMSNEALPPDVIDWLHKEQATSALLERSIQYAIRLHKAQSELRRRDVWFRSLVENAADNITVSDVDGAIVYESPSVERITGYSPDELLGANLFSLIHPDDVERVRQVFAEGVASPGVVRTAEYRHLHKNGTWRMLETTGKTLADPHGQPTVVLNTRDVTDARLSQEALQQSEERMRMVSQATNDAIRDWDLETDQVWWNESFQSLFGYKTSEIEATSSSWRNRIHPEDRARVLAGLDAAMMGGTAFWSDEYRFRCANDSYADVLDRGQILRTEGKPTRMTSALMDVSERKTREQEHRRRAEQQAAVARLGQAALADGDLDGVFTLAVQAVQETLGVEYCSVAELLPDASALLLRAGIGWREGIVGCSRLPLGMGSPCGYALGIDGPVTSSGLAAENRFEVPAFLADHRVGSALCVVIKGDLASFGALSAYSRQPREYSADEVLFVQSLANILAMAVLRKQTMQTVSRLAAVLEATSDFVSSADVSGRVAYMNASARSMIGLLPGADVRGMRILDFHPPWARTLLLEEALPAAARDGVWNGDTALVSQDGREFPVSQVLVGHRSPTGAVEFLSTIIRDVSSQRKLEEQYRQAQKMEAVGRLAGGVAHDFNNMLTVINGYASLLVGLLTDKPDLRSYAQEIDRAGQRAAGLTQQLLAFSRKAVLAPAMLQLNSIVHETEKMLRRLIGEDILLVTRLEKDLPTVLADRSQVEQILMNLLVNSRDAMPKGGVVTIATARANLDEEYVRTHVEATPGDYVHLSISDNGCGMDKDILAHVFEPFFTTKAHGQGTGLGLATVYGIVSQSDGHVRIESAPGVGTTVHIYLPACDSPEAPAVHVELSTNDLRGRETILLVEDQSEVRKFAARALEMHDYRVLTASSGEEALRMAQEFPEPIHVVVTDVVMPGSGGRELVEQLAKVRPDSRVLYMSGYTDDDIVRHGVMAAEVNFLQKPFTAVGLVRRVREMLDARIDPASD